MTASRACQIKRTATAALLFASLPAFSETELPPKIVQQLSYDVSVALDVEVLSTQVREGVRVEDVRYASPKGGRVSAYLVLPAGDGPFPAVLFLHPGQGDRSSFLEDAVTLAQSGVLGLLIDAPPQRKGSDAPPPQQGPNDATIQTIVDLRRGLDLLVARDDVDGERLGYVGNSLGATLGGILVAVDHRIHATVLMAGHPSASTWWVESEHPSAKDQREQTDPEQFQHFVAAVEPFDTIHFIGHAKTRLLFQFAKKDVFVSEDAARSYHEAAPEPKEVQWYDTGHFFNFDARDARHAWLLRELGVQLAAD